MDLIFELRPDPAPHVDLIWRTSAARPGTFISEAGTQWELVVTTFDGRTLINARGPETRATRADYPAGAEFFGITFKLGAFMPELPVKALLDRQDLFLPPASARSFWLDGAAWELPTFENADVLIGRLARQGLLVRDREVEAALRGREPALAPRTLQYRFLRATGLTHKTIQQIERARAAGDLLRRGAGIAETAFDLGYFDQAHLTNSLKRFLGRTPAQLAPAPACVFFQDPGPPPGYDGDVSSARL